MFSSAVSKNAPKFNAFCNKLIQLPNEKRFSFAFDFFESIDVFPKIKHKPMKSSDEALKLKNLGNAAFKRGHFIVALKMYTQSVSVAPAGSSDLAVAFGNRSAALFELKRYEGCIVDINRALNENCPEASRSKLLNRKQKCRSVIMELNANEFDYKKSLGMLPVKHREREMKKKHLIDEDALDLDYTGKFPIPKAKLKNKSISDASDKIKTAVNSTFGNHIVAVKDIEIGEVICVEKAYSSVLFGEHRYSHCANCFIRCEVLIPCPDCSSVMYCSRRCREDDLNRSHRIECLFFSYSYCLGLPLPSSFRLAIQTLIVVTKQGEDLEKLMKDPLTKDPLKQTPNAVPKKLCPQNAAHRIFSLLNEDRLYSYPYCSSTLSEAALSFYRVFFTSCILGRTAMVGKTDVDKDSSEKRKYIGLLFMKLTLSLARHCLAVDEFNQKEVDKRLMHLESFDSVGRGFYLIHSLFSHSCNKNVLGYSHKVTLVSQAAQPIKAGQQLCICYGADFLEVSRMERQKQLLLTYQFNCCCVACKEDWPLLNDLMLVPNNDNFPQLAQFRKEFDEFFNNPSCIIEYDTKWFDFFRKYLRIFHEKCKKPIMDYAIASIMFEFLLRSRGNNYVYTRDEVLMSL